MSNVDKILEVGVFHYADRKYNLKSWILIKLPPGICTRSAKTSWSCTPWSKIVLRVIRVYKGFEGFDGVLRVLRDFEGLRVLGNSRSPWGGLWAHRGQGGVDDLHRGLALGRWFWKRWRVRLSQLVVRKWEFINPQTIEGFEGFLMYL